jgi:Low affinity iron permease
MDDNNSKLSLSDRFSRAAQWTSQQCGRAYTFVGAIVIIVAWAVSGPAFHYSDTWQLIINTGTTIITFLMGPRSIHAGALRARITQPLLAREYDE